MKKYYQIMFIIGFVVYMAVLYMSSIRLSVQAKAFPLGIMAVAAIVVAIKLLTFKFPALKFLDPSGEIGVKKHTEKDDEDAVLKPEDKPKEASDMGNVTQTIILFLVWLGTFPIAVYFVGFLIAVAVWTFIFMVGLSRLKLVKALIMTVGTWVAIYILFGLFLKLNFPVGALFK